jgi:hypothetical protein
LETRNRINLIHIGFNNLKKEPNKPFIKKKQ